MTSRPWRSKSLTPTNSSRDLMCPLTVGWRRETSSAVREKLRVSINLLKNFQSSHIHNRTTCREYRCFMLYMREISIDPGSHGTRLN